jgi:hypothetical protein
VNFVGLSRLATWPASGTSFSVALGSASASAQAQRRVRPVPISAEDKHGCGDAPRVDLEARRLPHQAGEPARPEWRDLGQRSRPIRLGQLGNELAVQKALRRQPRSQGNGAHTQAQGRGQAREARADRDPPHVLGLRRGNRESGQRAEREPAKVDRGALANQPAYFLHSRRPAPRVDGNEVGH